ncbi:MAG: hypothetical protein L6R40_003695 [Gallowayella cf. fulva]|nr:MAG: hypothetical protein L6R40_003695 [Xanthomendoza cf. fulva]
MSSFYLSKRAPIMSSGWSGPGGKSSPMNDDEYRTYKLVKEAVKRREQEKKDADNAQRSSDGLPPLTDNLATRAKKALLKII